METNCAHDLVKYSYVIFLIRSHIIIKLLDFLGNDADIHCNDKISDHATGYKIMVSKKIFFFI